MIERVFYFTEDTQRERFAQWIAKQPLPFELVYQGGARKRTSQQNARLWKLHSMVADITGYSAEQMHEFALCRHFGHTEREVTDPLTGEIGLWRTPNKRSSSRNKREFTGFMEATEIWYGETFGVWLEA